MSASDTHAQWEPLPPRAMSCDIHLHRARPPSNDRASRKPPCAVASRVQLYPLVPRDDLQRLAGTLAPSIRSPSNDLRNGYPKPIDTRRIFEPGVNRMGKSKAIIGLLRGRSGAAI